jgi:hypothetical protein
MNASERSPKASAVRTRSSSTSCWIGRAAAVADADKAPRLHQADTRRLVRGLEQALQQFGGDLPPLKWRMSRRSAMAR